MRNSVYNEQDKLISLIDQIKKNDYSEFNLKYLFINNGSNDDSLDIIKKNKIEYLHLKRNKGRLCVDAGVFICKKI